MDAASLTAARATLADPEQRAVALLAALGGPSASADRSLPDGFLMEMMELREQVESELEAGGPGARDRWAGLAEARRRAHIGRVGAMFAALGDPASPNELGAIRRELNAWRYTERLIEQLDPAYDPAHADWRE